jgi:tetratricopeptide (TPR) repeat protein
MLELEDKLDEQLLGAAFDFAHIKGDKVGQDYSIPQDNEPVAVARGKASQNKKLAEALVAAGRLVSLGTFEQNTFELGASAASRFERFDIELELLHLLSANDQSSAELAIKTATCLLELDDDDGAKAVLENAGGVVFKTKRETTAKADLLKEISGCWLSHRQTEKDCLDNSKVWWFANRHIDNLVRNSRFLELLKFTDSLAEKFPNNSRYIIRKRASIYLRCGSPKEAIAELARTRFYELQNEGWVHATRIKCYLKMGALDTAHQLMHEGEQWMSTIDVANIKAQICALQGNDDLSLTYLFSIFVDLPNISSLNAMTVPLQQSGRLDELRSIQRFIEAKFPHSRKRQLVLAKTAILQHKYRGALHHLEQLRTPYAFRECLPTLSECYWHSGRLRESSLCSIAYSYFASGIGKNSRIEQSTFFTKLKSGLISKRNALEKGRPVDINSTKVSLSEMYSGTSTIKQNTYDKSVASILNTAAGFEASGNHAEFAGLIEANFEHIVSSVSSIKRISALCARLSNAQKLAGDLGKSISSLEDACYYSKMDRSFQVSYADTYRNSIPPLETGTTPKTSILILSCIPNKKLSTSLAQHLFELTKRKVFVVVGSKNSDSLTEAVPTDFGFRIVVPAQDDYGALAEKLTQAYRYLFLSTNCSGVLKVDDDISVADERSFDRLIRNLDEEKYDYMGSLRNYASPIYHHTPSRQQNKSNPPHASHAPVTYCDGGQGYYLSRKSLKEILEKSLTFFNRRDARMVYEDVWFSEMLRAGGIEPTARSLPLQGGYITDCLEPLKTLGQLHKLEQSRAKKWFGLFGSGP